MRHCEMSCRLSAKHVLRQFCFLPLRRSTLQQLWSRTREEGCIANTPGNASLSLLCTDIDFTSAGTQRRGFAMSCWQAGAEHSGLQGTSQWLLGRYESAAPPGLLRRMARFLPGRAGLFRRQPRPFEDRGWREECVGL